MKSRQNPVLARYDADVVLEMCRLCRANLENEAENNYNYLLVLVSIPTVNMYIFWPLAGQHGTISMLNTGDGVEEMRMATNRDRFMLA